ncbi:ankyrin-3 isoform X1 [Senna tora]|uniref:Ankyrin-3 isoform X1 n=1 Tax=Senna tora TaxID=362788 RepID=A0A834SZJ9_9FABA|nr:ankyrin-3 isoform X1 [Senna tora]
MLKPQNLLGTDHDDPSHLPIIRIPGDGRCLFRSVVYGACLRAGEQSPTPSKQKQLADDLRAKVVNEFIKRRADTEWFLEGDFESYTGQMRKPHIWGGEPELLMCSHVLRMPIRVVMRDKKWGSLKIIAEYGEEYGKDCPIQVLYHGYGHYDVLKTSPLSKDLPICIANPLVDVNFVGTASLKTKTTEIVLRDESPHEVRFGYEEFKAEVTPLFLAAHNGNLTLLRNLLNVGAKVNLRVFRGYATTAAVREGHEEVLAVLVNSGASQLACEEALMESSYLGHASISELLMLSNMIRPHVAAHALVSACCRGFVEVVHVLIKHGVDTNAISRTLLQSSKPFLHANVDCNALFAAVVSRQINVVRLLLEVGVRTDIKVKLGAWSWDKDTGEEIRVGAGLAEAYPITWCAVEYYESTGSILHTLLSHLSPNTYHIGRTLLHHAILCRNEKALTTLLNCNADSEAKFLTNEETNVLPIHMASRFGLCDILSCLTNASCNLNSVTKSGDSALMICARYKHEQCLRVLASAGADMGLVNAYGECVTSIAKTIQWGNEFEIAILDVIRGGNVVKSSNASRFSALMLAIRANDIEALKKLIEHKDKIDIDEQDGDGFSAAMIAAEKGNTEAFRLLLYAGSDVLKLKNKDGLTALRIAEQNQNGEVFEKIMLEYAQEKNCTCFTDVNPLHCAIRHGDIKYVQKLTKKGCDVNAFDDNGYTPLMLAARGNHGEICELLISCGAKCDIQNERHETALSLARENGGTQGNDAERVILDELARRMVLRGACVKKHTKCGKGSFHRKLLVMVGDRGILKWGKSNKRNVICRDAEVGGSTKFRLNRRIKFDDDDVDEQGLFYVVTTQNKEVHFVCDGGAEMAMLWVRGIRLVTREAIFGKNGSSKDGMVKVSGKKSIDVNWAAPPSGSFKLNTDGSRLSDSGFIAAGGIFRDQCEFELFPLIIESDSLSAVSLINNTQTPNTHPCFPLLCACRLLLGRLPRTSLNHIFREGNSCADGLAKRAVLLKSDLHIFDVVPSFLSLSFNADIVGVPVPRSVGVD